MGDAADELTVAWDRFVESLGRMGHQLLDDAPNDADRADALRFLLRQLAYREEQFIEFPRGAKPEFFDPESPTRKIFADCPDTVYRQFSVVPDATYRVWGRLGDAPYVSFTAYRAAVSDRVVDDLHDGEIEVRDGGSFELFVGGPSRPGSRLDLGDDAAFVVVREYCHDRVGGRPGEFHVEQLDPPLEHREEPTETTIATALAFIEVGLSFANDATMRLAHALRERPNAMSEAAGELVSEMAGTPHNHYQLCSVVLEPGQALRLELDPPEARYWSVHLNNHWLESPEFRDGQSVCINDAQAERNADGTITMLVGPDDPGGGNWLDTKGRRETILLARYLLPEGPLNPITTTVVAV